MKYVTVTYPNKNDAKFDFDYYMRKHIPMVSRLLGTSIEVCKGLSSPTDAPLTHICIARIRINSAEEFSSAMAQHGAQIMGDIPNYTNIEPLIQIDEVLI
ncbi:MAG TPA: EthD family reductase [Terriglobales bacterium]|nr:EthD family reductase [Terriglobales bacterium]